MKHIERHYSTQSPAQLFDLVADVERYPDFLPLVVSAKVFRKKENVVWTDLTMGTSLLQKQFTTIARLDRPRRIVVSSHDPAFERFEQVWTFSPSPKGGTDVEYQVELLLRSRVLQILIAAPFANQANTMVKAYIREARRLYGSA